MKKTMTKLSLFFGIAAAITTQAQVSTITFDTFTLSPNSYYQDNTGADFSVGAATFRYGWDNTYSIWQSGTAYTNVNDSVNGSFTNLYGSITGTAVSGSNYATVQDGAIISFTNTTTTLSGFYITNTTYAYKEIKNGGFGRKFGTVPSTYTGTPVAAGEWPDYFKIVVKGYKGGAILNDSIQFYLADFRAAGTANDYIVKNWQFVNCTSLGNIDSLRFDMRSSDTNSYGMKTPAFFSIDNVTLFSTVGINELESVSNIKLFPNPSSDLVFLNYTSKKESDLTISVYDISGKEVIRTEQQNTTGENRIRLETEGLEAGAYFVELREGMSSKKIKFIKL